MKKTEDLFNENYKLLKTEIQGGIKSWTDLPSMWIGRILIVKMAILPKAFYMFNTIQWYSAQKKKNQSWNTYGKTQKLEYPKQLWAKIQYWMHNNTGFQTILQSHTNKNSIVLIQKTDRKTNGSEQIQT
jgi:hypothetical protein